MIITAHDIIPGDIITTPGHTQERIYMVEGVHLGALDQEDAVELTPIDRKNADANGKRQPLFVPLEMLQAGITSGLFTHDN